MDNFSNMMMIGECLLDKKRVLLFKKALNKLVTPESIVLDGGTGSGIMAILAAKAGAKKVYAVEINPDVAKWALSNVNNNRLSSKVEIINKDLKDARLPMVDIVVMEMLDTALIAEQQVPALNNLIESGITNNTTQFIPNKIENYIQFCNYDFNFYDAEMPFIIQARNSGVKQRILNKITDKILINTIDFSKVNKLDQRFLGEFEALESGTINSFVIYSKIELCKGVTSWETTDMNMPVIVPTEVRRVVKGEKLKFEISYKIAYGFDKLNFSWIN